MIKRLSTNPAKLAHRAWFAGALACLIGLAPCAQAQLLKPLLESRFQAQQLVKPTQDAAPLSVQVSGTPTTALVSWTAPTRSLTQATLVAPGAAPMATARTTQLAAAPAPAHSPAVVVERLVPGAAPVRLQVTSPGALQASDPGPLTPGRAVTYRVTLTDARGVSGAKEAAFTPPPPRDPSGLYAIAAADGSVIVGWQEVPGVLSYQVTGVALSAPVIVNRATEWRSAKLPLGPRQWKVASVYEPGGVLTAASAWPAVMSRGIPTPTRPFLSMPNGPGSVAESTAAYDAQCMWSQMVDTTTPCPTVRQFTSLSPDWKRSHVWPGEYSGGGSIRPAWPTAAFADLHDLGVGRRVNCARIGTNVDSIGTIADPNGTVCWATSHGRPPAPGQSPNGSALANAGEQGIDINSLSVIVMTAQGAFFGIWEHMPGKTLPPPAFDDPFAREDAFVKASYKRYLIALDSQGLKSVPNACLSCHGGRYDPGRKLVVGASLLPLIPAQLSFSSPQAREQTSYIIRRINQLILESNPAPAIRAQITALYDGPPIPARGERAKEPNDAAVPPGWAAQAGLYRQVIAPYCGSCHFAQTGPLHFGSFANLMDNKQRIQKAVCTDFTMPHSEVAFRRFWSDGGSVSLPGLLSTVLGFAKCPQ